MEHEWTRSLAQFRKQASSFLSSLAVNRLLPWVVLAVVAGFSVWFSPQVQVAAGIDPFLPKQSRVRETLQRVSARFVGDRVVVVVYQVDDVFSHEALVAVRTLDDRLVRMRLRATDDRSPRVAESVVSLASVDDVEASEQSFRTIPLVSRPVPTERRGLSAIRQRARKNHLVTENLLSDQGDEVGAVVVRLPESFSEPERVAAVARIRETVARWQTSPGVKESWVTGKPVLDADENAWIMRDMARFLPVVFLVIFAVLFAYLRTFTATLVAVGSSGLAAWATVALTPALGFEFTSTTTTAPIVIATLSTVFFIHFLSQHRQNPTDGESVSAWRRTLRIVAPASCVAAVTTAIGFATNAVTDIPALRSYSIVVAGGVLIALLVSMAGFRLIAGSSRDLVAAHGIARSRYLARGLGVLAELHMQRPRTVLAIGGVIVVAITAGVFRLGFGYDQLRNFSANAPIRVATETMEHHVGGSTEMIVAIEHPQEDFFLDPTELAKLVALEAYLRSELGADRVSSIADYVKHMHRAYENDEETAFRLPRTPEQTAQLLALNSDERVYEYIGHRHDAVRVVARLPATDSHTLAKKFAAMDSYLERHFAAIEGYATTATGQHRVYAELANGMADSMRNSMILALVAVFFVLAFFFRSVLAGTLSLPPNVLPVLMNLGLMGWVGVRLDAATAIFATICFGIAVDDSVHFVQYVRFRIAEHGDIRRAVQETILFKGPALVGTSLLMVAGFSVMLLSSFGQIVAFGLIVCCGVLAALFGDLVVLPALIIISKSRVGVPHPAEKYEVFSRPRTRPGTVPGRAATGG